MDEHVDVRDDTVEIDLRDRLRFAADSLAADSLAADFAGALTADHAEALVFSSAQGLLARASVTEFVPILAERRARHAVRSGALAPGPTIATPAPPSPAPTGVLVEVPPVVVDEDEEPVEVWAPPVDTNGGNTAPLIALAAEDLDRLRDRVDLARVRVADWRADLDRR